MLWIICIECYALNQADVFNAVAPKTCFQCGASIDNATQHKPYAIKLLDRIWFCACDQCERNFNFPDPSTQLIRLQLASLFDAAEIAALEGK